MATNYNVDLDPRLFGRDASGKDGSSSAPADATGTAQAKPAPQQVTKSKDAPEYRITEVAIVVPSDGLKKDQPFDIKGTIQPLAGTLTKKKVRIDLITRYKGAEDKFTTVEADIDNDNSFTGVCKQLFFHDGYQRDKEKPADAKFTLEAKVSGTGAEKEVVSKTVDLPMATSTVILKKGKYDNAWSSKNEATHPKSGKEFVPDNKVKKLQENLITFRLLKKEQVTGMFDEITDAAVKKFQELAKKPERKKTSDVQIIKTEKITFDGDADGIVGEKTEKEIALWLQNSWVKPDPEYRKGDVDDNGVKNKHGERGSDKHHPGNGILDLQKQLTAIGAYKGKQDGWFGDIMEAAIKLFQDKASKGELVEKDGKKVEIKEEEKLKGHRNGVGDGATVEAVKKETEKGRKVVEEKEFQIDWDFIAKQEGTCKKIYVPLDKQGNVLGVSGPTIASGFDLGQIDLNGLKEYKFTNTIENKLSPYVNKKGNDAKKYVEKNPLSLSDEEVKEINKKVKTKYAIKAEKFYNEKANESEKFKGIPSAAQTAFASAYFQYGTAKTLRGNLVDKKYEDAIQTLVSFTTKTVTVKNEKTNKSFELMQYIERRCQEARLLLAIIQDAVIKKDAEKMIQSKEKEWEDAHGRKKFW
jgi:hypothetical protein